MARRMQNGQLVAGGDLGTLALVGVKNFAKRHKVISGGYIFGILVLLLAGSGTKLSLQQRRQYDHIMSTIDLNAEYDASNQYAHAMHAYRASKGWFTCDSLCQRNKARMEDARAVLDDIRAEGYNRMSDAKKVAGLFSEVGVGEVKDSFWEYFHAGKRFAKRQSMWDAMFVGMRSMSRDESFVEYALKMLLQVLVNFSLGLIVAFFVFVFGLWGIVKSYQPDPLTALMFFLSALCAGFAFVTTYLLLMYGAAAGGLYGMAKLAETNLRLQQGQGQQYRPVQGGGYGRQRQHYQ